MSAPKKGSTPERVGHLETRVEILEVHRSMVEAWRLDFLAEIRNLGAQVQQMERTLREGRESLNEILIQDRVSREKLLALTGQLIQLLDRAEKRPVGPLVKTERT
jgi:hypothetical protein